MDSNEYYPSIITIDIRLQTYLDSLHEVSFCLLLFHFSVSVSPYVPYEILSSSGTWSELNIISFINKLSWLFSNYLIFLLIIKRCLTYYNDTLLSWVFAKPEIAGWAPLYDPVDNFGSLPSPPAAIDIVCLPNFNQDPIPIASLPIPAMAKSKELSCVHVYVIKFVVVLCCR